MTTWVKVVARRWWEVVRLWPFQFEDHLSSFFFSNIFFLLKKYYPPSRTSLCRYKHIHLSCHITFSFFFVLFYNFMGKFSWCSLRTHQLIHSFHLFYFMWFFYFTNYILHPKYDYYWISTVTLLPISILWFVLFFSNHHHLMYYIPFLIFLTVCHYNRI